MKVLNYKGLELYDSLIKGELAKKEEVIIGLQGNITDLQNDITDLESETKTLKDNVTTLQEHDVRPRWSQTDDNAADFIIDKPTILTAADVSAQIKNEVGESIDITAITNEQIDALFV